MQINKVLSVFGNTNKLALLGLKLGEGLPLTKIYRKRDSSNTSHNSVDQSGGKAHSGESLFKETPFNYVIGFCHVKFDANIAMFPIFGLFKIVKCFISNKSVVSDKPTREKGTLLRADNVIKEMFDSVGYGFGNCFKHDIT
jgi:hypothetical protein